MVGFAAKAENPLDQARASERAALLLIDLEAAVQGNVRCADICLMADAERSESDPTGNSGAVVQPERAVLRPTDDIRFGSGFPESVPPIVLHPAARTCDIASVAVARADWLRDLTSAFLDHPGVDGDFVAGLIHPHIAELTTILGHLRDAIEPRSRSAIPGATGPEVTR